MSRVLLDQNVPAGVRLLLPGHDVQTAFRMGWAELASGDLLTAAETAGFEVLISCDQHLPDQQNLTGRRISVLVLNTNRWAVIRTRAREIDQAVSAMQPSSFLQLQLQP